MAFVKATTTATKTKAPSIYKSTKNSTGYLAGSIENFLEVAYLESEKMVNKSRISSNLDKKTEKATEMLIKLKRINGFNEKIEDADYMTENQKLIMQKLHNTEIGLDELNELEEETEKPVDPVDPVDPVERTTD